MAWGAGWPSKTEAVRVLHCLGFTSSNQKEVWNSPVQAICHGKGPELRNNQTCFCLGPCFPGVYAKHLPRISTARRCRHGVGWETPWSLRTFDLLHWSIGVRGVPNLSTPNLTTLASDPLELRSWVFVEEKGPARSRSVTPATRVRRTPGQIWPRAQNQLRRLVIFHLATPSLWIHIPNLRR